MLFRGLLLIAAETLSSGMSSQLTWRLFPCLGFGFEALEPVRRPLND